MAMAAAWKPIDPPDITSWVTDNIRLPPSSPFPGGFQYELSPWIPFMLRAATHPDTREFTCIKNSGASLTQGVLINTLLYKIAMIPCDIIGMLPNDGLATRFMQHKFEATLRSSHKLNGLVDLSARKNGNTKHEKKFMGGFLMLVGSGSAGNLQMDHVKFAFVDEASRCEVNSSGQGSSIEHLRTRIKAFADSLFMLMGSPAVKGFCATEAAYLESDQRVFPVPCHECGEAHVLEWENVKWLNHDGTADEIFGNADPSTAYYQCPCCGSKWDESQKRLNVRSLTELATKPFTGHVGYYINEIYSFLPGGTLENIVRKYLKALKKYEAGDDYDMMVWTNTSLGKTWERKSDTPEIDELRQRSDMSGYSELIIPNGGIVVTTGIDFHHDRIAIQIIAKGRNDETWILYFGEMYGNVKDKNDPIWDLLADFIFAPIPHASGAMVHSSAYSLDTGDGSTAENVYDFIRKHSRKHKIKAVKGSSNDYGTKEIFSRPKAIDTRGKNNTKASKHGLHVYIVGTHRAKDKIYSQLGLTGHGAGRIHWYSGIRSDYFEQLTSEVKVPSRTKGGKESYQKKSGIHNEALDTLVYCEHAQRSLGTHVWTETRWKQEELNLVQSTLFDSFEEPNTPVLITELLREEKPMKQSTTPQTNSWLKDQAGWL